MSTVKIEHILFIDIETAPIHYTYKELSQSEKELWDKKWMYLKDATSEQHYAKAGIYAEFAKVVCIGLGYISEGKFRTKAIAGDDEKEILVEFSKLLQKHFNTKDHFLCAHNGKEFDFPFLCRRLLVNKLPLPKLLQIQGFKPWEVKHIDTMEMWRFGDIKNFTSLNLLAHIFNIPSPKDDIDGSQIAKVFYEEKNIERIKEYCMKDVVTLARIYQSLKGLESLSDKDIIYA
jgi:predicted PolB exonuclease-like 3'-5' exonuclease